MNKTVTLEQAFEALMSGTKLKLSVDNVVSIHNEIVDYSHNQGYVSVLAFSKSEDAYVEVIKDIIAPRVTRYESRGKYNDVMMSTYSRIAAINAK